MNNEDFENINDQNGELILQADTRKKLGQATKPNTLKKEALKMMDNDIDKFLENLDEFKEILDEEIALKLIARGEFSQIFSIVKQIDSFGDCDRKKIALAILDKRDERDALNEIWWDYSEAIQEYADKFPLDDELVERILKKSLRENFRDKLKIRIKK